MNLSKLYTSYDILSDAKDTISEHQKEYVDAINATKGGLKEKQLAAQIISKFFKHFPDLQLDAMDAVFNLCEDDDSSIRIAAMKTLPSFCKDSNKNVLRVADISAQLLQLQDPQEYNVASNTLLQVLKQDPNTVIKTVFKIINDKNTEEIIREKCLKFMLTKLKLLDKSSLTIEVEDLIIKEIKDTLRHCTSNEFIMLMSYLVASKCALVLSGQQDIVELVGDQIEIVQTFSPTDEDNNQTDRLVVCMKYAIPYFSSSLESTRFVQFYCDQVLPHWEDILGLENGKQYQLAIAQQLAELCQHCGSLPEPALQINEILEKLKSYMPCPPEDLTNTTMPHFNFTMVESLLYALHRLGRQNPECLNNTEVIKDFRARLMYFTRGVQGCMKVLNFSNKDKILSPEERKVREISPKLLKNIQVLTMDLLYLPPVYKSSIVLSFKVEEKKTVQAVAHSPPKPIIGSKRHAPIVYENNGSSYNKQSRNNRSNLSEKKIYTPPSGKFSHNFHNNDRNPRFRTGRGAPRGMRSRGRGGYRN